MEDPAAGLVDTDYVRGESPEGASTPRLAGYSLAAEGRVFGALLRQNFILTSSVLVRRELLARAGLFNPHLFGCEDIELWLRVARRADFARAGGVFAFKRDHPGNITRGADFPFDLVLPWWGLARLPRPALAALRGALGADPSPAEAPGNR